MKSIQTRVRVNQDDAESLRHLADESGLQQVEVATMLLHAALVSVRESGGNVPFPVRFAVINREKISRYALQETARK